MTEGHREDKRTEADAAARGRRVGVGNEGVQRIDIAGGAEEGEEMVRAPQGLEAQILGPLDDVLPFGPADAFLALDHHAQLHCNLRLTYGPLLPSQHRLWPDRRQER